MMSYDESRLAITEFDDERTAVINPSNLIEALPGAPRVLVSCFSGKLFLKMLQLFPDAEEFAEYGNACNKKKIYKVNYRGTEIGLVNMFVGASSCVGLLEELFQMGSEKVILFGTCGVLDESIKETGIIVPDRAVRDEGTSFHYAAPSRTISVNDNTAEHFIRFLEKKGIDYINGKTWTTDSFYRETPNRVARRKEEGCICVDMECSAVAALAKFRKKEILHFFYSADVVSSIKGWDQRTLGNADALEDKYKVALVALEYAVEMSNRD